MINEQNQIEDLLPGYFEGTLTETDRSKVERWKQLSADNLEIFIQTEKVWKSINLLKEMEQYSPQQALQHVNRKIQKRTNPRWWFAWQKVAAILVVPLLIASVWLWVQPLNTTPAPIIWQTFSTPPGIKASFYLPDSTKVWMNSSSSITYPDQFTGDFRQVAIKGEIFFDVRKDLERPFIASMDKLHVKVMGTRFNVINYEKEDRMEVILESGRIELCSGTDLPELKTLSQMKPGELAVYSKKNHDIRIRNVDAGKYISWIDGKLIFKDDPMEEVIRKLNRWFNVNIEVKEQTLMEYVYTATFQDESIDQILELLTMSAPIHYTIVSRQLQEDNMFSAKRIIISKRQ
jgi:transmembrane sensor